MTPSAARLRAARNVISGNQTAGVAIATYFTSTPATNIVVQGNYIGTDPSGMSAIPNVGQGVYLTNRTTGNLIGGNVAGAGNLISGNSGHGVNISGSGTNHNVVQGNFIGTDVTGKAGLNNSSNGVEIEKGAQFNLIGTNGDGVNDAAERNVVSGNFVGINIGDSGTNDNVVAGNYIGTDYTGTVAIGNLIGLQIVGGAANNLIGTSGTDVDNAAERNVISGNGLEGVRVQGAGTDHNMIAGNYVGTDVSGTTVLGNGANGVRIYAGATNNTIGGSVTGMRNVISANANNGVNISDSGTNNNVIEGNFIGTDVTGTVVLPNKNSGVLIQNGASANIIGGSSSVDPSTGKLTGAGNLVSGNLNSGVQIFYANGNFLQGNFIGTDVTGEIALGNDPTGVNDGIDVNYGSNNTIGGVSSVDAHGNLSGLGNLVSGNTGSTNIGSSTGSASDGIAIVGDSGNGDTSTNNVVEGNFIGTDVKGTTALGNALYGVDLFAPSGTQTVANNTIGGVAPGTGNLISANGTGSASSGGGIRIYGQGVADNLVEGNLIGTDAAGTHALPNATHGVFIASGASFNTIGGTTAGAGNVISGNALRGIRIRDESGDTVPTVGTQILGNSIGVDANGNPLPNGTGGISILSASAGVTGTIIGGTVPGAANIIAYNDGPGVSVEGNLATGNTIQGNSIHDNTALGIDLGADGVTPNHTGFEAGPNNFQNYPVLIGAQPGDGFTEIVGTFNSLPNATYTLDFYDNPAPDPTGFGQGQVWLGSATVTTDSSGNVCFDVSVLGSSNVGDSITATATDSAGNTSECSRFVVAGLLVTNTNDSGDGSLRQAILNADASSITLPKTIGFNIPTSDPGYDSATGTWTIQPSYVGGGVSLPVISSPVILAGWTQGPPGYNGPPLIDINGSNASGDVGSFGFNIQAGNTQVYGFAINDFADVNGNGFGIGVFGTNNLHQGTPTTDVWIYGNDIGTDATGMVAEPNGQGGIWVGAETSNVLIGTNADGVNDAAERNIISGNSGEGILLQSSSTTVAGNYIGLSAAGTGLGNQGDGIDLLDGASSNTIGGTSAAARNIISGESGNGILMQGSVSQNLLEGNYLGTDPTGELPRPNGSWNVFMADATQNTIGGTVGGAGNVISAAGKDGIGMFGAGVSGNVVQGNLIGLDASGTHPMGNTFQGIYIGDGVGFNPPITGAPSDNLVGGTVSGAGNTISANSLNGIAIHGVGATGNLIQGNDIGTDASGSAPLGNHQYGIEIANSASQNTVGGTTAAAHNVISGNAANGVELAGSGTNNNVVAGNFIGTDVTGTVVLPNHGSGVLIQNGASANIIGGSSSVDPSTGKLTGAGNLISGNLNSGVQISEANGNYVQGNFIGTDVTGEIALGNDPTGLNDGIDVNYSSNNTIGGVSSVDAHGNLSGLGNLVSGNKGSTNTGPNAGSASDGIAIYGDSSGSSTNNVVEGNFLGTDVKGAAALGNALFGVDIFSGGGVQTVANNTIGGVAPGTGNLISANATGGVRIVGSGAADNLVEGNLIGTNAAGTASLGNEADGIDIVSGANDNTIGGTVSAARNVISGNAGVGVYLISSTTNHNLVIGNYIGTDVTGMHALGNALWGLGVNNAPANQIGGTVAGAGNVISGNHQGGLLIYAAGATGNLVQGNLIGTDASGTNPLGNAYSGVYVGTGSRVHGGLPSSAANNTIGGTASGAGNVISDNGNWGLWITGAGASGNVAQGNTLQANALGGVRLDTSASNNTIGGSVAGAANIIASNANAGVAVVGAASTGNTIQGNSIYSNQRPRHRPRR